MIGSFSGRVLDAARIEGFGGRTFTALEISDRMQVMDFAERKRVRDAIGDMKKTGKIVSVEKGRYRLVEKQAVPKCEVMWRYLRMERVVDVEGLRMVADVSEAYASEWLANLIEKKIVVRLVGGRHRLLLVDPPLEPPRNEAKAAKLREMRRKRRDAALQAIRDGREALDQAERAILEMEDEDE